jgi:competence protein ComEA
VLPPPRRRIDPDLVRERLRALAGGLTTDAGGRTPEADDADTSPGPTAPVVLRSAARPVVVAVATTALAVWLVLRTVSGPAPAPVEVVTGTPIATVSPSPSAVAVAAVVVHVVGEVRRPGLVRLAPGARVADAVRAAGGVAPGGGTGGLNLARPVVDGEQILVSADSASAPPASAGTGSSGTTGPGAALTVLDLNAATVADLDSLPGVGPVLAGRIVAWRDANGRFASVDQLREVSGIGARTFERLKPLVRV